MTETKDSWAIVDLIGHVIISGRITKPGEYGGLWRVDVPEGDTFHTEFFGSQAVYRVRMVSEEIARAYAQRYDEIIAYNAPIITQAEHLAELESTREELSRYTRENEKLRRQLAFNTPPK